MYGLCDERIAEKVGNVLLRVDVRPRGESYTVTREE